MTHRTIFGRTVLNFTHVAGGGFQIYAVPDCSAVCVVQLGDGFGFFFGGGGCPWLWLLTNPAAQQSWLHSDLFYEVIHYRLILWDVGFCRSTQTTQLCWWERERELTLLTPYPTSSDFFLPFFFFFFFWRTPLWHLTPPTAQPTNMMNFWRAAPPWRHLIIERKKKEREEARKRTHSLSSYTPLPRLSSPLRPSDSRLSCGLSGASVCCTERSGVHVSRSGGGALHCSAHWFTE